MRFAVSVIALLAALGCKQRPGDVPEPSEPIARDGGLTAVSDAAAADQRGPVKELAGTWRGEMDHPQYGKARGDVVIDADGNVSYSVSGEGVTHSGVFRILKWTGSELRIKDQGPKGGEYTVKASLSGPRLELLVPPVGKIVLNRAKAAPLPN